MDTFTSRFSSGSQAAAARQALVASGLDEDQVRLASSHAAAPATDQMTDDEDAGESPGVEHAGASGLAGVAIGTAIGLGLGLAVTPLVGPIGAAAGAGAGAYAGSLIGALSGMEASTDDVPAGPIGVGDQADGGARLHITVEADARARTDGILRAYGGSTSA